MSKNTDIYKMDLHDDVTLWGTADVVRVPGGWIYRFDTEAEGGWRQSCVFVPYSDEFNPHEIPPPPEVSAPELRT